MTSTEEPLIAAAVAAVVLGEPVLLISIVGGGLILLGVWMVNKKEAEPVSVLSNQIGDGRAREKTNTEAPERRGERFHRDPTDKG